ncbi:MAG: hypothetical protein IPH95_11155 [Candidatus Promineofilum sp.]|nr:hypothetical protein [Promineifilum sp.]
MDKTTQPWAVVMQLRDGSTVEQVFATRFQAESFLYLLPLLMTTQPDGDDVASAILSPLVEHHPAAALPTPARRRIDHYLQ